MSGAVLLMVALSAPGHASNSKITTGVLAVDNRAYADAVEALEAGLADPSKLKAKNVPRGWEALGRAYAGLAGSRDGDPGTQWEAAVASFNRCLDDERYGEKCREGRDQAATGMLQDILETMDIRREGRASSVARAQRLDAAWPDGWVGQYALGVAAGVDTKDGAAHFDTAWERYEAGGGPDHPSLVVTLIHTRSMAHGSTRGPDAGTNVFDHSSRVLLGRIEDDTDRRSVSDRLDDVRTSLDEIKAKVDAYRTKAEAADATVEDVLAWGVVQSQFGRAAAAQAIYERATERFPESFDAWYTLGAHHYNRAAAVQAADGAADDMRAAMQAAKGPLQKAVALKADPSALQALSMACSVVMDLECMKETDAAMEALR